MQANVRMNHPSKNKINRLEVRTYIRTKAKMCETSFTL